MKAHANDVHKHRVAVVLCEMVKYSMVTIIISKSKSWLLLKIVGDRNRGIFPVGTIFSKILTLFASNI